MKKLENQYKSDGCDLSLTRLRQNGDFLAPVELHSTIKDSLEALVQIDEHTFDIRSAAFDLLITNEPERLQALVKSKCYLEKQVKTQRKDIFVPKARVADLEEPIPRSPSTASANVTSVRVNNCTISIGIGDLTAQAVRFYMK